MASGGLYTVRCPHCGQPSSVCLATPDTTTCDACGYSGELPAETAERLRHAFEVVRGLGESERHLSSRQRRALTSSLHHHLVLIVIAFFSGVPALLFFLVGLVMLTLEPPAILGFVACATPGVIMIVVTVIASLQIRRSRRALAEATVASPPAREEGAASCRLCGGPLPAGSGAVIRCEYCDTDNVVATEALRRASRSRLDAHEGFERDILEKVSRVRRSARMAGCAVVATAVGAPVGSAVVFFVIAVVLVSIERPVGERHRYSLVETDAGNCVGVLFEESDDRVQFSMSYTPPPGTQNYIRIDRGKARWLKLDDLVGREVCAWHPVQVDEPVRGEVERVYGTMLGENYMVVEGEQVLPEGTCLVETDDQVCARPDEAAD